MSIKVKKRGGIFIGGTVLLLIVMGLGIGLGRWSKATGTKPVTVSATASKQPAAKAIIWTCSMHPQIRKTQPGKCPICGMTLIPLKQGVSDDDSGTVLKLSPRAVRLADIRTAPVRRDLVTVEVRMVGKVDFVESKINYITARMPGRIDKLFIDYTGIAVKKGDHMAEYFSADLMVAQKELLIVMKNRQGKTAAELAQMPEYEKRMFKSVLGKFANWGLTKDNIKRIIDSGKVNEHLTLYAPVSGIVIQKNALEGKYFKTGDRLFTVVDLSAVWIMLDAYESDLMWLRYGQLVEFTTVAYPGQTFKGRISFIDPVLDNRTRTVKIRVDADNAHGKLKPGMFVNAVVKAGIAKGGKVVDNSLAGKWIGPMHPKIIRDKPGKCPICGMKLVKAESLGYVSAVTEGELPLVIPATAPLITGTRAVVYVRSRKNPGTFYGREVILGPRAGNYYIVKSGLKVGEQVVTNGNFKIDSSLQIQAKPSMMTATATAPASNSSLQVAASFRKQLNMIYNSYFAVHQALAKDDFKTAKAKVKELGIMLGHISTATLDEKALHSWKKIKREMLKMVQQANAAQGITDLRATFASLSAIIDNLKREFGTSKGMTINKFSCPMAFDNKGAEWLQQSDKIANPYFGQAMPGCGEKVEDKQK
jgi:Cu(I)/Ag(I) efflux system membrane fusion protein